MSMKNITLETQIPDLAGRLSGGQMDRTGAAAKSLSLATLGQVEVSPTISAIDPDICVGCRQCIELCPYGAITFNALKGVSEINPAVCKGCGSCAAHGPSGAAKIRHFTAQQIFAEIEGILDEQGDQP